MSRRLRRLLVIVPAAVVVGLALGAYLRVRVFAPRPPAEAVLGRTLSDLGEGIEVVARGLEVPWELAFLPDGDLLVTERPGRLVQLGPDGAPRWSTPVPGVVARGEGGLLGLALHPAFAENRWIYLYLTAEGENRVERHTLGAGGELRGRRVILEGIPAASFHDGGRIAFGPDGLLYVTTGDAGNPEAARDPTSLAGKVLRVDELGGIPSGNPFGSAVYSLGHRNAQGLAWDDDGVLWVTEHGRSGLSSGLDEVNRVLPGLDFGWPEFQGDARGEGVAPPVLHSGPDQTWAPSGAAWLGDGFLFGGLRGQAVYEVRVGADGAWPSAPTVHFFGELGRVRQVRVGPDGMLYVLTGNRDGRGRPRRDDDRVLRIDPSRFWPGRSGTS